ncbi:MAG: T9SS type A sorting domain-containing protein [Nitrososphaerales archaeon]
MKTLITPMSFFLIYLICTSNIIGQSVGDYRSAANGNWSSVSTWETWNGSSWIPAGSAPSGNENITVDDTVVVNVTVNITGYVRNTGIGNVEISGGLLTFANGSTFEHARNAGGIPVSTWGTGSTLKITGTTSTAPANRNQSFYNIIFECPGQLSNLNMGFDEVTIGGDISIVNTGASARWYLCGPVGGDSATVTINGDIIQTGGQFSSNGSGNAAFIEITVNGDIIVSNGNFSVSRGSQGGTGTTKWYLHGSIFSMTNATTQNSNAAGAKFVFSGSTPQNLTLSNVTFTGGFPVEVASNAILYAGESEIEGSGDFILNSNSTLGTGNEGGIDSTLQVSGTITLSSDANYTFNGNIPQVTGTMLPSTVNNMGINNSSGVTLVSGVTVNGDLTLTNGDLHLNGHYIDLDYTGTLIETAGNTVTDPTGSISATRDLNAPNGVNLGGLGAMFTSTENLFTISVSRRHSPAIGNGNQGILRQFMIDFVVGPITTSLRFFYDESELNGIPEANLTLFNSPLGFNNTWSPAGGVLNTSGNYLELLNLPSLTPYWTFADINNPLPVELVSFTAELIKSKIVLDWTTATETNNSGWNIERKLSDQQWQRIGFVEGKGNSTSTQQYSFTDRDLNSGNHQYRLQQIDYDGTTNYSEVVEVDVTIVPDRFALYQNYPNPFNPSTTIKFDVPFSAFVSLSIYNSIGEKVGTVINEQMEAGVHSIRFDASNLSSGIYIYRLTADNQVFANKMLLIK